MTSDEQAAMARLAGTLDRLVAYLTREESKSSVEIAQNAKGEARITVKLYGDPPSVAASEATRLYDELTAKYGG